MWSIKDEHELNAIGQLSKDSDRAAAIVGMTILHERLGEALRSMFPHADGTHAVDEMFGRMKPLSTFSAQIHTSFLVGLFSKRAYDELITINHVRNRFAHYTEFASFDQEKIRNKCLTLTLVDDYFRDSSESKDGTVLLVQCSPSPSFPALVGPGINAEKATARGRYLLTVRLFLLYLSSDFGKFRPAPIL